MSRLIGQIEVMGCEQGSVSVLRGCVEPGAMGRLDRVVLQKMHKAYLFSGSNTAAIVFLTSLFSQNLQHHSFLQVIPHSLKWFINTQCSASENNTYRAM